MISTIENFLKTDLFIYLKVKAIERQTEILPIYWFTPKMVTCHLKWQHGDNSCVYIYFKGNNLEETVFTCWFSWLKLLSFGSSIVSWRGKLLPHTVPYRSWFVSQFLHFHSSSVIHAWRKQRKMPHVFGSRSLTQETDKALGSSIWPGQTLVIVAIQGIKHQNKDGSLSLFSL